jgi:hypothetical protein
MSKSNADRHRDHSAIGVEEMRGGRNSRLSGTDGPAEVAEPHRRYAHRPARIGSVGSIEPRAAVDGSTPLVYWTDDLDLGPVAGRAAGTNAVPTLWSDYRFGTRSKRSPHAPSECKVNPVTTPWRSRENLTTSTSRGA